MFPVELTHSLTDTQLASMVKIESFDRHTGYSQDPTIVEPSSLYSTSGLTSKANLQPHESTSKTYLQPHFSTFKWLNLAACKRSIQDIASIRPVILSTTIERTSNSDLQPLRVPQ